MNNRCFIVLGMHRSATSLVARGLHKEVNMGNELLGESRSNRLGHYEDMDFLNLNIRILEAAGGDWRNLPSEARILEVGQKFNEEIKDLLTRKRNLNTLSFGFKDPRTILTINLYLPILRELGIEPFFITCFRDKMGVAKSLLKRDNISIPEGLSLANSYEQRLIKFLNEQYAN